MDVLYIIVKLSMFHILMSTQRSDAGETRTRGLSVSSQALIY